MTTIDGMYPLRMVLEVLVESNSPKSTKLVAQRCHLPETSVRRHLPNLPVHGVIDLLDYGPELWQVSKWTQGRWRSISYASFERFG
jgi:predicted ArsR family transcriptional regulator